MFIVSDRASGMRIFLVGALLCLLGSFVLPTAGSKRPQEKDNPALNIKCGEWWNIYLDSQDGNSWFYQWNTLIQAKLDVIAEIAEREGKPGDDPFRVVMSGDSTMRHQYGAICGFLSKREGCRFDPNVAQASPGCCADTVEGGGRGMCFELNNYRFLSPKRYEGMEVDAFYFGAGLHLLHMTYGNVLLEPLRVQEWLAYEKLLEDEVSTVRETNGPNVRIAFMTIHTIADSQYAGDFAATRDAWRIEPGNGTTQALCESQVKAAAIGKISDFHYWEPVLDVDGYTKVGEGDFTVDSYCKQALMDRQGSLQLNRRAKPIMARLGVPIVDGGRIVDGQVWATKHMDGRHYHPLVPLELIEMLGALTSPPPPPMIVASTQMRD